MSDAEQSGLPSPLEAVVADLARWLDGQRVAYAIVGGIASSLRGRPRLTRDVDALLWLDESSWPGFLDGAPPAGFVTRRVDTFEFARELRVFPLRHGRSGLDVDLVLGSLPFERLVIERATLVSIGGTDVRIATTEDLAVMKAVAQRPRDIADLEGFLDAAPALDLSYVRGWLRQFSDALGRPALLDTFEEIVKDRRVRGGN